MKTKLFIDFDGTCFDTRATNRAIFLIFSQVGFTHDQINNAYQSVCLDYCYSFEKHLKKLQEIRLFSPEKPMIEFQYFLKRGHNYVFPDVKEFLIRVNHERYEVVLFSLGDIEYQQAKVRASGLSSYFDDQVYTEEQKWKALGGMVGLDDYFILIDDRGDTIYEVTKKFKKSLCIEINRSATSSDLMEPQKQYNNLEIKNFLQLEKILAQSNGRVGVHS